MTLMLYASIAVKPPRNSKFVGYDLRFQKVRSMKPIAPKSETHMSHGFVCIQLRYGLEKKETALRAAVARS